MSSIYTVSPASLHDLRDPKGQMQQPHHPDAPHHTYNHAGPVTPVESHWLSPYSSHVRSNSASPTGNSNTPAESISTVDIYQASDFSSSDFADDPFFGANFNDVETGTPAFLEGLDGLQQPVTHHSPVQQDGDQDARYPMSPHKTPSIPNSSSFDYNKDPTIDLRGSDAARHFADQSRPVPISTNSNQSAPQLTPDTNGGSFSSDDSRPQPKLAMASHQSPRVTVSMWNRDEAPIQGIERSFTTGTDSPRTTTLHAPHSVAGDLAYEPARENMPTAVPRDAFGHWLPDSITGQRGLAPENRPGGEVPSPNQLAAQRQRQERDEEVKAWVDQSTRNNGPNNNPDGGSGNAYGGLARGQQDEDNNVSSADIPLGDATENRHIPGQAYLDLGGPGGPITQTDIDIMRQYRNWEDAPALHQIQIGSPYQPETSQAAIEKFNRQCQDNESVVSHAATWGTRRRSLPSLVDMDGIISGSFLKKLSISGSSRRPSFIKKLPSLVRKPSASQLLKRKGSNASEMQPEDLDEGERRESKDSLAPPSRTSSWGISGMNMNKKPTPSLNTALVGMATGAAAIGTTHARSGSISATPIASPKSPFGSLSVPVKNTLRRPRSKTELPRSSHREGSSHPNLVGMLKKQGGPPVAQLARSQPAPEQDDDDDDDDDGFDDADMKTERGRLETIVPTFAGFQEHVLRLNPSLASSDGYANPNAYLVDRIAHQMIIRYKQLQVAKVKHINHVNQGKCHCGHMCIALGGSAIPLDNKGGDRGIDPLSGRPDSSDGDNTPLEGGINSESFPAGIPMPPTATLPAEFECQLCFNSKRFQKPSDWTKHVHEDVQPFTCTWDKCRDPKMFKRKADWVRHENEGHRHLEWWMCDVEDCRHTCYRRDNFLQHLVREHKFTEPKVKTKAAIKKAGGGDRTWQKVEQCHVETPHKPPEEPCRFCGKTFPTWKKLTVHLAKHMENISLPVLKLVAAKELEADTVISPVQDPPPRSFDNLPPVPAINQHPSAYSPQGRVTASIPSPMEYHQDQNAMGYPNMPQVQLQTSYYDQTPTTQPYSDMPHNAASGMMMPQAYNPQPQYHAMPVTTAPDYSTPANAYMNMQTNDLEPFPAFNSLGIQDPSGGMVYDPMANPVMQSVEQYPSNQGSVSPYSHSPHRGQVQGRAHSGTFYNP